MKHRLRRLNDYYEDQQEQIIVSKPLPPLPATEDSSDYETGTRGAPSRPSRNPRRPGRGTNSQPSTEELDTEGLLNYEPDTDMDANDPRYLGTRSQQRPSRGGRHESYEMDTPLMDPQKHGKDPYENQGTYTGDQLKETKEHHHRTLGEMMHGHRPDRHLFPYRSWPENKHALWTFVRRFYLVLLIIPAWTIPNVLTAKGHAEGSEVPEEGANGAEEEMMMLSKWVNMLVFVLNLLAMMHLGKAAGACMEELVPKLGMSIVSIFDAMTSSSVEMAVAAFALMKGMVRVVQAAMLGAILNNLLLMMGLSFVVGGIYHNKQEINPETSQTGMNLLMIVCISYVIPVALEFSFFDIRMDALPEGLTPIELLEQKRAILELVHRDIWTISKFMAILMLVIYGCCLYFQFNSRSFMVTPEAKHSVEHTVHHRHVHYWFAGWGYSAMLAAQIYSASLLVHSVEALGKQFHLNDSFVGFILLPIVLIADLQEEVIAIKESRANRLDRSIALMIGSCMQIALLVTPLLVLLGWILDVPMTFRFTVLEAAILAGSVLIVNYLLQDNETNWLEGSLLLAAFLMCAISFYFDIVPFGHGGGGGEGAHGPAGGAGHAPGGAGAGGGGEGH
ncbi:hypothetical protein BGX31_010463 [Mortierella sp. GBA43]|nr:hypothetical protein BGX31_010463 [Mortierella sp. GBA43]